MRDLLESIFGTYTPVTYSQTLYEYDETGALISETVSDLIPSGASGIDWTYVLGVVAFLVVLYCILRMIGSVISRV